MAVGTRLAAAAVMTATAVLLAGGTAASAAPVPASATARAAAGAAVTFQVASASPAKAPTPFTAPNRRLKLGAKGAAVKALQTRLRELGYVPGKIDAKYGGTTMSAVWAFQKVQGIKPTSTVTSRTWRALENPKAPKVLVPRGKPDRVEVNLTQQVAVLYDDGVAKLVTHISSGSGIPYCETAVWQGRAQRFCGDARTPTGNFKTTWRRSGWHKSYLGQLYNPIFFNGGIAFHGALSVPLYPASHGCVRLPMHVAEILPGMLGTGVPVHVRGKFRR
ncbi:L,D-transpeptidase family protein [Sphaerisporangium sp. B11E5]|uniref:L,D-transpeptidase family protein n=1 Tax=Sphaerisporangium sp. B11E5 TaxID=3153563 RepID=UPI00325F302E